MKKITLVIACFLFFIGITLSSAVAADTIKVGVLLPLTGKLAKFGEIENKSFLMAAEEINTAGGVNGKKIKLIIEDTTGKRGAGRSAIEKLITHDKVLVVGGGYSSSVTWATIAVAQQNKVPFLVNTGPADKITEQGWQYIFRLNPPVSEYLGAFAAFVKEIATDLKTAALVHENSLLSLAQSKRFVKQIDVLGLKVLIKEGYKTGTVDFKPLLVNVKAKNPDLVYLNSHPMDAALLMRQSKELNLNPNLFVGNDAGFTPPEFENKAAKTSEFVYSATLWTPSVPYPGAQKYYHKFRATYNRPADYHGAQAYAAMYVIADALKRVKSLTPKGVRDALATTDMMTVFGPVKFMSYGKKTQQNRLPTLLVQWIDGKLETVWPKNMATKKHVYPTPNWGKR